MDRWAEGFSRTRFPQTLAVNPLNSARNRLDVNFQEVVHSAPVVNADVATTKRFAEKSRRSHFYKIRQLRDRNLHKIQFSRLLAAVGARVIRRPRSDSKPAVDRVLPTAE
jgi:hypothetical protein